jgi:hypothetical protein
MLDTVIACVNALGTDKPKQLIFTNQCRHPIGDVEIPGVMDFEEEADDNAEMPILDPVGIGGVELPGVDVAGQAPQTVEIDDLDIPQPDPLLIVSVQFQVAWHTGCQDYAVYSNAIPILHIALVLHTSLAANTTSIC